MGVPGFYSWLTRRYPMIKQMIDQQSIPQIDYLYLDMNGIIYRCVRDDSIIFKSQLMPKELEDMWLEIFNYINSIVSILKPTKMIIMALDGVAPRCKMNNQRARRFRSAQDYKEYIERLYGYTDIADSQQNFKNNSISPGTSFMNQLNEMLHFYIQKKIQEDDYWKSLSIVFTGSDTPGEGEHKIMEFVRANQANFLPDDTHCFYGADADLIMLGLTLPVKNACIIREEYIHSSDKVNLMSTRETKQINFQLIYLTVLKEFFDIEYQSLKDKMQIEYNVDKIARDFVFLFFFIGNDFLPRIYAYNIREKSIEKMIQGFKAYLCTCEAYITDGPELNLIELLRLLGQVGKYEESFFSDKQLEFDKLAGQEQKNFQDQLQKQFLAKIRHESDTLLKLKQMYSNVDGSGKINYYSTYFQIDATTQVEELWNILAYYVYGLKFVYEYYFKNLASWSWYYPHYFAPLLTDIQYYLGQLIAQGQNLANFQLDQPFEPFKQLLCILPKESADLLPQNFKRHILDAESKLRQPVDFYPDNVQTVTYGSIRAHQAIYIIPFLDQAIVCDIYDQEIGRTNQADMKRNILRDSKLYEYHADAEPVPVDSPFHSIASFTSKAIATDVSLIKKIQWKTMKDKKVIQKAIHDKNLLKMPSLNMRSFQIAKIEDKERGFSIKLMLKEKQGEKFKVGEQVYYGYPVEHSGRIEGILTKNQFLNSDINLMKYSLVRKNYNNNNLDDLFKHPDWLLSLLRQEMPHSKYSNHAFYNMIDLSKSTTFLFLIETRTFSRTIDGQFKRLFKDNHHESYTVVPACVVSKQKHYQSTKSNIKFSSIQEEFPIGENVLITHFSQDLCGAKAKVVGYDHHKVKVEVVQQPRYRQQKIRQGITKTLSTKDDIFFSIKFAAAILDMKFDHLSTFLGSINVVPPKHSKLPPSIDIGLNLMSRKQCKIVPNLVRVNFHYDRERKLDNPFKYIELSVRALQILIEYKQKFPQIFTFMIERHRKLVQTAKQTGKTIDWDAPIYTENIFADENSVKSLMKVYKWLVEMEQTHMPACSLFSKQVNLKRLKKLKELFDASNARKQAEQLKKANKKYKEAPKVEILDPNFLFSHRLSQFGYLYLKKKPKTHEIGDLVICVNPEFFGHYGAIVGIDDNKYEVFFDEASFGKNDLGGLCDNLWGGKFEFRELLNLTTWPELFTERIITTQAQRLGWNDSVKAYQPLYKSKPFEDFKDLEVFTNKEENKKYFTPEILNFISQAQKNLKQVQLDKDYIVVDNRREDYRYKYDKKVTYIQKKQVQEAAENIKAMEETADLIVNVPPKMKKEEIFKEVQGEVIENKAEETVSAQAIGEQEDAEDILG